MNGREASITVEKPVSGGIETVRRTGPARSVLKPANEYTDLPENDNNHLARAAVKAYDSQTRQVKEDKLIVEYLPMVHKIVAQVTTYLHPPLSRDDLVSAGTIGLVKAARDYDPTHQAEFKTYAYIRIRGAVIDELRGWSFAPSNLKKQFDQAQQTMREMTEQNGVLPTDKQLAEELGISVEKLYRMFENARARHFLSIHGQSDEAPALGEMLASEADQPSDPLEKEELTTKLTEAIAQLPEKQRKIIILYYTKELTMKQVASLLEVTESRVSQLHAAAIFKLSNRLKQFSDIV